MKTLGRIIKAVCEGIVKVSALLFISFGLWLPALYTATFFIVCAVRGIRFGGIAAAVFWCGLGIAVVAGLTLAVRRKQKKMSAGGVVPASEAEKQDKKRKNKQKSAPTESAEQNAYAPYGLPPQGYAQQPVYMQPPVYAQPPVYVQQPTAMQQPLYVQQPTAMQQSAYMQPPAYGQPQTAGAIQDTYTASMTAQPNDTRDLQYKYFGSADKSATYPSQAGELTYASNRPADYASGTAQRESATNADMLWRRLSGGEVPDEQPLVFRTRRDPDVFVYEYSDRYQYWRRTRSGMMLEQTEYKQDPSRRAR